ncbi:MAG: GAF domain-containing protein [Dehalococcoidia bacterium]
MKRSIQRLTLDGLTDGDTSQLPTFRAQELLSAQTSVINDLVQCLADQAHLDAITRIAVERLGGCLSASYAAWLELQPSSGDLAVRSDWGEPFCRPGDVVLTAAGYPEAGSDPLLENASVASTDDLMEKLAASDSPLADHGLASGATVPVVTHRGPVGVLAAFSLIPGHFASGELQFMSTIAGLIGLAVEFDQDRETSQREKAEDDLLEGAAQIIHSSLNTEEIFEQFAAHLQRLLTFDRIAIARVDDRNGVLVRSFISGAQVKGWQKGTQIKIARSVYEPAISGRAPAIYQDNGESEVEWRTSDPAYSLTGDLRSLLLAPIIWRDEVIAILALRSFEPNAYSDRERNLAKRVADQIAGALANSFSHSSALAYGSEKSKLANLGRIAAYAPDLSEVFPRLAESIRKLIPFDRIILRVLDLNDGTITSEHRLGTDMQSDAVLKPRPVSGTAAEVIGERTQGLIVTPKIIETPEEGFSSMRPVLMAGLKSTLAVPIVHKNRTIGSLVLRARAEGLYSDQDLVVAERIASQIAGALANTESHRRLNENARETLALVELARTLSSARGLQTAFDHILDAISKLMPFDRLEVFICDEQRSAITCAFARGIPVPGLEEQTVFTTGANPRWASGWSEMFSARYGPLDAGLAERSQDMESSRQAGLNSCLQVPLRSRNRLVGSLSLKSMNHNAYGDAQLRLMERVAGLAGPAIDNINTYETVQTDAGERSMLAELTRTIGHSSDIQQVYEQFAKHARLLVPSDRIAIRLVDLKQGTSKHAYISGYEREYPMQNKPAPLFGSVTEFMARTGRPIVFQETGPTKAIRSIRDRMRIAILERGFNSALSLPISVGGTVVGVVHFRSCEANRYQERHIDIAEQLVGTLAGAMTNATAWDAPIHKNGQPPSNTWAERHHSNLDSEERITLILADENLVCRSGLRDTFKDSPVDIVGEFSDLGSAMDAFEPLGARVILWDIHDGNPDQLATLAALKQEPSISSTVILSDARGSGLFKQAVALGTPAFLLKGISPSRLIDAVSHVASGGAVVDPSVLSEFLTQIPLSQLGPTEAEQAVLDQLSVKDVDILRAMASGLSNAEIADMYNFATGTIKNRLARLYRVLGVTDRAGATRFAVRVGISR